MIDSEHEAPASRPAFLEELRGDLLDGASQYRRRARQRRMAATAAIGVLVVALGTIGLWRSADTGGTTMPVAAGADDGSPRWTEVVDVNGAFSPSRAGGRVTLHTVEPVGDGFLAFGTLWTDTSSRLVGWRSSDGLAWVPVYVGEEYPASAGAHPPSRLTVSDIAHSGDAVVVLATRAGIDAGLVTLRSGDGGATWSDVPLVGTASAAPSRRPTTDS